MFPWIAAILLGALAPALLGALVPALMGAGLSASIMILPMAFGITLGHAILLGLPVALFYRAKQWKRVSAAIIGAALIGAIPVGILAWPLNPSSKTMATDDDVATIIDGVPTLAGWLNYLNELGTFGGLGAVGGLVFWLTLRWSGELIAPDPVKPQPRQRHSSILLAGAAITASLVVFMLPDITKDRSCHNIFRDGRRSAAPRVSIGLDVARDD
jgi:hypothetical protein